MSKCRPKKQTHAALGNVQMDEVTEAGQDFVLVKVPVTDLLEKPEVQALFQDIITISTPAEV